MKALKIRLAFGVVLSLLLLSSGQSKADPPPPPAYAYTLLPNQFQYAIPEDGSSALVTYFLTNTGANDIYVNAYLVPEVAAPVPNGQDPDDVADLAGPLSSIVSGDSFIDVAPGQRTQIVQFLYTAKNTPETPLDFGITTYGVPLLSMIEEPLVFGAKQADGSAPIDVPADPSDVLTGFTIEVYDVPEPSSLIMMLGLGVALTGYPLRWRKRAAV